MLKHILSSVLIPMLALSISLFCFLFLEFSIFLGIHIHRAYGQKNKLKHGNLLSMLYMLKAVSFFVRFGMWGGFQTRVCFLLTICCRFERHSLAYSMQMNIEEFLNCWDAADMESFSSLFFFSSLYDGMSGFY